MKFSSKQISGKGRGKLLGFPTINLEIPAGLDLKDGIYAAVVRINGREYKGALHFGPIPTFDEEEKSLEVFLIDAPLEFEINGGEKVDIEIKDFIRDVRNFDSKEELVEQIGKDVKIIEKLLYNK